MPTKVPAPRSQLRSREPRRTIDLAELKAEADVIDVRIRRAVACQRQDTHRLAYDLAEMDQDRRWSAYEFKSLVRYARDRGVDYSPSQIRQLVAVVRSLERLPWSRRAFKKGVAGWTRLRELARYATPENEKALLEDMLSMSGEQFQERLRRLRGAPDRRKLSFEVTLEERDDVLAAIAKARADDSSLTTGQALARVCKSYLQGAAQPAPALAVTAAEAQPLVDQSPPGSPPSGPLPMHVDSRSSTVDATPGRPATDERADGARSTSTSKTREESLADRQHGTDSTLSGDPQRTSHMREPRRAARRGVQLVVELDTSGLCVRRVEGPVLGRVSFAPSSPGPEVAVSARPETIATPDAGVRAG
jgi:hypothetical protein